MHFADVHCRYWSKGQHLRLWMRRVVARYIQIKTIDIVKVAEHFLQGFRLSFFPPRNLPRQGTRCILLAEFALQFPKNSYVQEQNNPLKMTYLLFLKVAHSLVIEQPVIGETDAQTDGLRTVVPTMGIDSIEWYVPFTKRFPGQQATAQNTNQVFQPGEVAQHVNLAVSHVPFDVLHAPLFS